MYDQNSIKNEESKAKRVGKKVMFALFCVLFASLVFIIFFRNAMMQPTSKMKQLIFNDELISAKSEYNDELAIYTLYEYNSNDSRNVFVISNIRYIESIGQFQFTLRWNNNVIERLMEKDGYSMSDIEGELFRFAIADDTGRVYTEYEYLSDSKFQYGFRRIVFNGIDVEGIKSLSVLAFTTYEKEEILLSDAFDEIPLFVASEHGAKYKMSKAEKNISEPNPELVKVSYKFDD